MIYPIILCGGSGTRLWPRSRAHHPKPFLPLIGATSLFEQTVARCRNPSVFFSPYIVTGAGHYDLVVQQIRENSDARLIVEPSARNTAPAIALAALRLPRDAVIMVCPSDHHIKNNDAFWAAVTQAAELAKQGQLVALAINAVAPETGYGYIKRGAPLGSGYSVDRFVEKPDLKTAERFLDDGGFSWNGGIFVFEAGVFLDELKLHRPDMLTQLEWAVAKGQEESGVFYPEPQSFDAIVGESIDYAVMERTSSAAMVPVNMGWSDIGNWQALRDARDQDSAGNSLIGPVEIQGCTNILVETDGPRVSVIGLDNVLIVVDGDEVLVTSADGAQHVGKLGGARSQ